MGEIGVIVTDYFLFTAVGIGQSAVGGSGEIDLDCKCKILNLFPAAGCRLPAAGCRLPTADCR